MTTTPTNTSTTRPLASPLSPHSRLVSSCRTHHDRSPAVQALLDNFIQKSAATTTTTTCLPPHGGAKNVLTIDIPLDEAQDAQEIVDFIRQQQQQQQQPGHTNNHHHHNDNTSSSSSSSIVLELSSDHLSASACQVFCDYFQGTATTTTTTAAADSGQHDDDTNGKVVHHNNNNNNNHPNANRMIQVALSRLPSVAQTRQLLQALSHCTFLDALYLIQLPALHGAAGGAVLSDFFFIIEPRERQPGREQQGHRLQHLLVAYSALGPTGARALQTAVQQQATTSSRRLPRKLSLIGCNLGNDGVEAIVQACCCHGVVRVVDDTVDNGIDNPTNTNASNAGIQELDLSNNQITSRGLSSLTKLLLQQDDGLQVLKLRYNPGLFQNLETTRHFCQTLLLRHASSSTTATMSSSSPSSSRPLLHTLDIEGCQVSVAAAVMILQTLEKQSQSPATSHATTTTTTLRALFLGRVATQRRTCQQRANLVDVVIGENLDNENNDDDDELRLEQYLASSLPKWKYLQQLVLHNIDFLATSSATPRRRHVALRQALHQNTSLVSLSRHRPTTAAKSRRHRSDTGSSSGRRPGEFFNTTSRDDNTKSDIIIANGILERNQRLLWANEFLQSTTAAATFAATTTTMPLALAALGSQPTGASALHHVLQQQLPFFASWWNNQ